MLLFPKRTSEFAGKDAPEVPQEMSRIQHAISMRCLVVSQRSVEPELDAEWGGSIVIADDQDIPGQLRHFLEHPRFWHSSPLISALISARRIPPSRSSAQLRALGWTKSYQDNESTIRSKHILSHQETS